MKLLHTSDWHLGMTFRSGISYIADQKTFIDEICRIAVDNHVDGIMIAGDVFDKSIASQEALALYDESMTYICGTLGIPVYIVAGNHDGAERLSSCNKLLEKTGLHIAGVLQKEPYRVDEGDVSIYMLPWISTDRVKATYPEEAEDISSLEDGYRVVLNHYRESFTPGQKNIIISHAFIADAETSTSDRTAEIGRATMVSASVFDGFDYVALGHLHGPQQITDTIRYSGTPMAYSFGKEESQNKSVTIIDTDTGKQDFYPLHPLMERHTLKGTYEDIVNVDITDEVRNGYLRIEVSDSIVGMEMMASLREHFPNILEIAGRSLERDDARITMTIDEFESADTDPESVFGKYLADMMEMEPNDHILGLFRQALSAYEKGVSEE